MEEEDTEGQASVRSCSVQRLQSRLALMPSIYVRCFDQSSYDVLVSPLDRNAQQLTIQPFELALFELCLLLVGEQYVHNVAERAAARVE